MPTPVKIPAVIAELTEHAPDLRTYLLAPERPVPRFRPGQFLHLALDPYDPSGHWPESRVFSIASSPQNRERLRITVSRKGAFTTRMFKTLQPGSAIWLKLPYGSFQLSTAPDSPTILLAGGTGITPFISFIEWSKAQRVAGVINLHYAARRPNLLIYHDVLEGCRAQMPLLDVVYYAEEMNGSHPEMREGRISISALWADLENPERARYYLSGPQAMVGEHREALLELGAPVASVMIDEWGG